MKDLVFKNASIGKKIVKLAVYYEDGKVPSKDMIVKRIVYSIFINLFPLSLLEIIFKNKTSSDKKYNTIVTNLKK